MKYFNILAFILLASCQTPKELPIEVRVEESKTKAKSSPNCICPMIWMPVCGENGKTYSNACAADCVSIKYTQGSCAKNSEE
jgi:hypothetical protein